MLEIELNSYPIHSDITLNSSQIVVAMQLLNAVLTVALKASNERLEGLVAITGTAAVNTFEFGNDVDSISNDTVLLSAYPLQNTINQ